MKKLNWLVTVAIFGIAVLSGLLWATYKVMDFTNFLLSFFKSKKCLQKENYNASFRTTYPDIETSDFNDWTQHIYNLNDKK